MMNSGELKIYAPASSGNLSVGFDALGLALAPLDGSLLGDSVRIMPGRLDDWVLSVDGPFARALPSDQEENVVILSCRRFEKIARAKGADIHALNVTLDKRLPVGSGLGSSASSIVAALVALNEYFNRPLDRPTLLGLMAEMEGGISGEVHLDNIAPSLVGGLRLCIPGSMLHYALPWPARWRLVVSWPGSQLNTRVARKVLPTSYDRKTAVAYSAQFAQFVHHLHQGETTSAANCMVDLLAEPSRSALLPGFENAKTELAKTGVLATGISGSGPTIFCLTDDAGVAETAANWLNQHYLQTEKGFVHICRADLAGARRA